MTAEKFATELGISKEGKYIDGVYVITLDNSDEYSRVYTILDKSEIAELNDEEISLDVKDSIIGYYSPEFYIKLQSDFDNDVYTVSFEEIKDEDK